MYSKAFFEISTISVNPFPLFFRSFKVPAGMQIGTFEKSRVLVQSVTAIVKKMAKLGHFVTHTQRLLLSKLRDFS